MDQLDLEIKEEVCNEYEFESFSLIHNLTTDKWEFHFLDDEEGELFTYIENNSFEEESDLFSEHGFTREMFDKITDFEVGKCKKQQDI